MDFPWFISQEQLSGDKMGDRTRNYNSTVNYGKGSWL